MKKIVLSVAALVALAGCSTYYDYYKGGVKYVQDGKDCIYYAGENGKHFSSDIRSLDTNKKIVYRNTRCADLYAQDNAGIAPRADRQVLAPVSGYSFAPAKSSCGCNRCAAKRPYSYSKYVLISE